jgi:protein phosphatase
MVYIVADGMGGHRGGAEAARIAVEGFQRCLLAIPATAPFPDAISFAASETHKELVALGNSGDPNFSGMGSTVVIALIRQVGEGFELIAAHMGDSRLYLHRAGQLTLLTRDHTQVQWLVDANEIDEEMARSHPDASVLTRALGHGGNAVIDVSEPIPLGDSDGILLCSDGLSGFVGSHEIDQTIKRFPEAAQCVCELIQLALHRGSNDNVTVQFLRVGNQPEAILPMPSPARKTLPEAPVLAAAPVYYPHPGGSGNRRPMFAGVAIGLVLVAGGVLAFRDKLFPAHADDIAAVSMERNIGDLRADASGMIADAKRGENLVDKALSASIGAQRGWTNRMRGEKLRELKAQFHDLYRTAGEILQTTTFENKLSARRNKPAGKTRDSTDAALEAAIEKSRENLNGKKKELAAAMARLEKLTLAASPAEAQSPPRKPRP